MSGLPSVGKIAVAFAVTAGGALLGWIGWLSVPAHTFPGAETTRAGPADPMTVGMNLGVLTYWSQEFAFTDIIAPSSLKLVQPNGRWVELTDQLSLDATGHPIAVAKGTVLGVNIRSGTADRLPAGRYDCAISPGWSVRPSAVAKMSGNGTRFRLDMEEPPQKGGLTLKLTASADHANLTQLSCRNHTAPPDQIFNPQFLADNRPFAVVRFMDWMKTNNQPPQTWAGRTTAATLLQSTPNGVAVEHMVALANTLHSDPWFTLPLDAPDDYYRQFARYVHDHLRPDRRAYVEVSNEVWNRAFLQSKQASVKGALHYPTVSPVDANDFYYADRVRAVMAIWSTVYQGQSNRIVRVLSTQAGSKNRSVAALTHLDTARSVDALAIAPYFGPGNGKFPEDVDVTEYVLAHANEYIDTAIRHGIDSKSVAERFQLRLITYEGGPDYVSYRPRLTASFAKAEHDPRMYAIYTSFLERWHDQVGGLYMPYNSVNERYGHMLYTGQPLSEAPKMRALIDFMKRKKLNGGR